MPWLNRVHAAYADKGLVMVGVHTPEFFYERDRRAVAAETEKLEIKYPQLIDRDGDYWELAGNRAWPSVFLVDKRGRIQSRYTGTIRVGDLRSVALEREIEAALAAE